MDEMGVEMFADKKDVKVFVRPEAVPPSGNLHVGVPQTSRRCTLVACIAPDGNKMTSTIITKTKTFKNLRPRLLVRKPQAICDGYEFHHRRDLFKMGE